MTQERYDIVIGGAGIAGLLLASKLSKDFSVLVIESRGKVSDDKYWVTPDECLEANPELFNCVDNYFSSMLFSDAYQFSYSLTGKYILWNTEQLIKHLIESLTANNAKVEFSQRFCGYRNEKNGIRLFVNNRHIEAKLFVDCMGYNSPIVLAKDMIQIEGYYLLNGAKLNLRKPIVPICLSNLMLQKRPKYFEVFPTKDNQAYATMIYPSESIENMSALQSDLNFIINSSIYAEYFQASPIVKKLWGIVPVGRIKRKSLERIFFFGEAAQNNPAATGTCLTRLLLSYSAIAGFLGDCVKNGNLSEKSLAQAPEVMNDFARNLQMHAYKEILSWNSDRFSSFIKILNHVDHSIVNEFFFGNITLKQILSKENIFHLLKGKKVGLSKLLLKAIR